MPCRSGFSLIISSYVDDESCKYALVDVLPCVNQFTTITSYNRGFNKS